MRIARILNNKPDLAEEFSQSFLSDLLNGVESIDDSETVIEILELSHENAEVIQTLCLLLGIKEWEFEDYVTEKFNFFLED